MTGTKRAADTDRFYTLLTALTEKLGRPRLRDCSADGCPRHGVYFFFEDGETRADGRTLRVVRIGTHALTERSQTSLWGRLRQHRGTLAGRHAGGGNHRGSIFRLHVGTALLNNQIWPPEIRESWLRRQIDAQARAAEQPLERAVSAHIGAMPVACLAVPDREHRRVIEANAIALLSRRAGGLDQASAGWLGLHAASERVRTSALWNVNHVDDAYDPAFLDLLEQAIREATR
ncbi:MAG TPA: hypothetical protein VFU43_01610 [Streptosporangiaceae bacterium]|nr:hypothetical protein [Streptosporangiaceae bacterium]